MTACEPIENGKFEYFISFVGLSEREQAKLRDWIMTESFRKKNARGAA